MYPLPSTPPPPHPCSVSAAEVSEAIFQQTGRNLPESDFTLPDIKTAGSFECTVRLHPEVTGTFTVVVQKEKLAGGKDAAAVGKAPAKRR